MLAVDEDAIRDDVRQWSGLVTTGGWVAVASVGPDRRPIVIYLLWPTPETTLALAVVLWGVSRSASWSRLPSRCLAWPPTWPRRDRWRCCCSPGPSRGPTRRSGWRCWPLARACSRRGRAPRSTSTAFQPRDPACAGRAHVSQHGIQQGHCDLGADSRRRSWRFRRISERSAWSSPWPRSCRGPYSRYWLPSACSLWRRTRVRTHRDGRRYGLPLSSSGLEVDRVHSSGTSRTRGMLRLVRRLSLAYSAMSSTRGQNASLSSCLCKVIWVTLVGLWVVVDRVRPGRELWRRPRRRQGQALTGGPSAQP